jgi:hypothetical protein
VFSSEILNWLVQHDAYMMIAFEATEGPNTRVSTTWIGYKVPGKQHTFIPGLVIAFASILA